MCKSILGQINEAFVFPVGNGTYFREARISAPLNTTDHFTCQYFLINPDEVPYDRSLKDPSLDHISACEYWQIDRTNGSSNVLVTLSWNANTYCGVSLLSDLKVARWNGAMWKDLGNGGTTGNTTSGSIITSAAVSSFSPFTLASSSAENPLPVELLFFENTCNSNEIHFSWSTASERNAYYFEIEGSNDGITWSTIHQVSCAGNTTWQTDYNYTHSNSSAFDYFRLTQYDFDGTKTSFEPISNQCENSKVNSISMYPNPTTNSMLVQSSKEIVSYHIISIDGKIIVENNISLPLVDASKLRSGTYYIEFLLENNQIERIPFVKQ